MPVLEQDRYEILLVCSSVVCKSYVWSCVRGENKFFMESNRLQISKPIIQVADTAQEIPNVVDNPKNVGT